MFLGCNSALTCCWPQVSTHSSHAAAASLQSLQDAFLCVQASVPKDRPVTPPKVKAKEARQAAKAAAQAPKAAPPKASEYVELLKKVSGGGLAYATKSVLPLLGHGHR